MRGLRLTGALCAVLACAALVPGSVVAQRRPDGPVAPRPAPGGFAGTLAGVARDSGAATREHSPLWGPTGPDATERPATALPLRLPVGAALDRLPPSATTVWIGGLPYFYAGGSYFLWRERERRYEVVEAPVQMVEPGTAASPPIDDLYVAPRFGQDAERQVRDRGECRRSATALTGFDPLRSDDGPRAPRDEYRHAVATCLDARGYAVR